MREQDPHLSLCFSSLIALLELKTGYLPPWDSKYFSAAINDPEKQSWNVVKCNESPACQVMLHSAPRGLFKRNQKLQPSTDEWSIISFISSWQAGQILSQGTYSKNNSFFFSFSSPSVQSSCLPKQRQRRETQFLFTNKLFQFPPSLPRSRSHLAWLSSSMANGHRIVTRVGGRRPGFPRITRMYIKLTGVLKAQNRSVISLFPYLSHITSSKTHCHGNQMSIFL